MIDDHGRAVTRWSFGDEIDARMFRRAMVELARLHRAAGAKEIITFYQRPVLDWREGEDFDAFLAADRSGLAARQRHRRVHRAPDGLVPDGLGSRQTRSPTGAASCTTRKGVWIGDASAFPTAPGVNPMISIMSLAHRTAANILAAA